MINDQKKLLFWITVPSYGLCAQNNPFFKERLKTLLEIEKILFHQNYIHFFKRAFYPTCFIAKIGIFILDESRSMYDSPLNWDLGKLYGSGSRIH